MEKINQISNYEQLLREKQKLRVLLNEQKAQLELDFVGLKYALWPLDVLQRFKNNLESFASNKLVALGVEAAYLAIRLLTSRRNKTAVDSNVVKSFITNVLDHFIRHLKNPHNNEEQNSS